MFVGFAATKPQDTVDTYIYHILKENAIKP